MKNLNIDKITIASALISALAFLTFIIGYNVGADSASDNAQAQDVTVTTQAQAPRITERERVELCKQYIVENKDYNPSACEGIQEDDARLDVAYRAINQNGTGDICLSIYALQESDDASDHAIVQALIDTGQEEDTIASAWETCEALGYAP